MYNGQTKFYGTRRRIVVNRRTGLAGILAGDDDLTEVVVTAKKVPDTSETNPTAYGREVANSPYRPTEYDEMQEIVSTGTRILWWVWGIAGALGVIK